MELAFNSDLSTSGVSAEFVLSHTLVDSALLLRRVHQLQAVRVNDVVLPDCCDQLPSVPSPLVRHEPLDPWIGQPGYCAVYGRSLPWLQISI